LTSQFSIDVDERLQVLPAFYFNEDNLLDMEEVGDPDNKDIVVIKAPLAKLLQDPRLLDIYREMVKTVNRVVTASYLLARFIFIHAYEDYDEFNADIYITPDFFTECLRALQTGTRRTSTRRYFTQSASNRSIH
jgi:hypothetical protein